MIRMSVLACLLAASWLVALGPSAEAAASSVLVSPVTVRYDALDLRSEDGITRLYRRLQQAARVSCESLPGLDRWTVTARSRCIGETLEVAIRQVRDAGLTAHHRGCQRDATGRRCPSAHAARDRAPPLLTARFRARFGTTPLELRHRAARPWRAEFRRIATVGQGAASPAATASAP